MEDFLFTINNNMKNDGQQQKGGHAEGTCGVDHGSKGRTSVSRHGCILMRMIQNLCTCGSVNSVRK